MLTHEHEADILANYLIRKPISSELAERYQNAIQNLDTVLDPRELRLWQHCLKHPVLLSYIDSGMALHNSFSKIRKRIYIMFCILETTPDYAGLFLPKKRSLWYVPGFLFDMGIAAFKGVAGLIIIKIFYNGRN